MLRIILSIFIILFCNQAIAQSCSYYDYMDLYTPELNQKFKSIRTISNDVLEINKKSALILKNDSPNKTELVYGKNISEPQITIKKNVNNNHIKFNLSAMRPKLNKDYCDFFNEVKKSRISNTCYLTGKSFEYMKVIERDNQCFIGFLNSEKRTELDQIFDFAQIVKEGSQENFNLLNITDYEKGMLFETQIEKLMMNNMKSVMKFQSVRKKKAK